MTFEHFKSLVMQKHKNDKYALLLWESLDKDKLAKLSPYLALIIVIAIIPLFTQSSYYLHILILTFIYIIVSVSFRFIAISGQFPLAHIVFMGIGGYASGVLAIQLKWSPWLTMPLGALLAMAIGILIGFPFARLRALYYALGRISGGRTDGEETGCKGFYVN